MYRRGYTFVQFARRGEDGLGRALRIQPAPRKVYKYVDLCDAKYLEQGSLKIGSFYGYAALEGPRADAEEATAVFETGEANFDKLDERNWRAMNMMGGVYFGPAAIGNNIRVRNQITTMRHPDMHCLCFSLRPDIPHPDGKPQAVFEVRMLDMLCMRLREMYGFLGYRTGQVEYGTRQRGSPFGDEPLLVNPFLKPQSFDWEQEVRVMFTPATPGALAPLTEADPFVAYNLRRLADV